MVLTANYSFLVLSGTKSGKFNRMIGKVVPIRKRLLVTTNQHFKSHSCHLSYFIILLNSLNLNLVWSLIFPTHRTTIRLLSTLSQLCSASTVQGHISNSLAERSHSETTAAFFGGGGDVIAAPNLPAHILKSCKLGWEIVHRRETIKKTEKPGIFHKYVSSVTRKLCCRKEVLN
jgi:hypothetical protein